MINIEKYAFFELRIESSHEPKALFTHESKAVEVRGFQISSTEYAVRFMPDEEGLWKFVVNDQTGEFVCSPNKENNHGPVVVEGHHFRYTDGTTYCPVGTTCYAWINQTPELVVQTLESLKNAPFNKIRMCVFPKHMPFNSNDPEFYPFQKNEEGRWDVTKPDFDFWTHLDLCIQQLCDLGIEADLILFHPYDRWGFSELTHGESLQYIDYCVRRLSAYRNVWWSLANEYDLLLDKTYENWQDIGKKIAADDPYAHLISVHNFLPVFPKNDWMTHCSMQHSEVKHLINWRKEYDLPVIIDECGYEGDIAYSWGNLSAFEMVHRAWTTVACGGFITHGETFDREDEVLWWAKGGKLYGDSVSRFEFLKAIQYEIGDELSPITHMLANPNDNREDRNSQPKQSPISIVLSSVSEAERNDFMMRVLQAQSGNKDHRLYYLGRTCPWYKDIQLPENGKYRIEVIDVWEMTRTTAYEETCSKVKVELPAKEGIAIMVTRLSGDPL